MKLLCDWRPNRGDVRVQLALVFFRLCQWPPLLRRRLLHRVARGLYKFVVEWTWGMRIPWNTQIGEGLIIHHGTGLVVHGDAVLGRNVTLRQNVCIGEQRARGGVPTIGDSVDVGVSALVLGPVQIGARAVVGAGAVVLRNVPSDATAIGVPAKLV